MSQPEAGMFVLIDVSSTGLTGEVYALDLLEKTGVAVMPGSAFGVALDNWVRVALSVEDKLFEIACQRIIDDTTTTLSAPFGKPNGEVN